jgi:hypothetical protein
VALFLQPFCDGSGNVQEACSVAHFSYLEWEELVQSVKICLSIFS